MKVEEEEAQSWGASANRKQRRRGQSGTGVTDTAAGNVQAQTESSAMLIQSSSMDVLEVCCTMCHDDVEGTGHASMVWDDD